MKPIPTRSLLLALLLSHLLASILLTSLVGCQQRAASKLQGRWEGRPDSAALRAKREAEKYGDVLADSSEKGSATKANDSAPVTDWEKYEVSILFDFVSSERLEMSLDGEQPRSGNWKIVSTSPTGYTIEVQTEPKNTESAGMGSAGTGGQDAKVQRRQFELLLDERDGTCVGFLLTEAGADRQLGAIYFQRP